MHEDPKRHLLGQKFAQYEIKIVMSWLLRRFRFVTDRSALRKIHEYDRITCENIKRVRAVGAEECQKRVELLKGMRFAICSVRNCMKIRLHNGCLFLISRPLESQKYSVEATLKPVNGMRITVVKR